MQTDWRQIPTFPDYEISSVGEVRRLRAKRGHSVGTLLAMKIDAHGYRRQLAIGADGKYHVLSAHVAVLEAFVGLRPDGCEASHLNGNQVDNRLDNLCWESSADNHRRKLGHGTLIYGAMHKCAKLSDEQVRTIRRRKGERVRDIGADYGVSGTLVSRIQRGLAWPHVA